MHHRMDREKLAQKYVKIFFLTHIPVYHVADSLEQLQSKKVLMTDKYRLVPTWLAL